MQYAFPMASNKTAEQITSDTNSEVQWNKQAELYLYNIDCIFFLQEEY